jgi:hypothetical protein
MTASLVALCQRARPEVACLGEMGRPLIAVVGVIERLAETPRSSSTCHPEHPCRRLDTTSSFQSKLN